MFRIVNSNYFWGSNADGSKFEQQPFRNATEVIETSKV
jgi:hypothetical protein